MSKMRVFTGGVEGPEHFGLRCTPHPREANQQIHLVFVGNDAFRKGGLFVLDAFDSLRRNGVDAKLTFIGSVTPRTYVTQVQRQDRLQMLDRLKTTKHVTWVPGCSNRAILTALVDADIGLLPTLDDSLGWSVIEMMASCTPVIASNVVALPELIENGTTGRLLSIPRDEDRRWVGIRDANMRPEHLSYAHQLLVDGLVAAISTLYRDEDQRMQMAYQSRYRYEKRYTPEVAARQLRVLYDEVYECPVV